MALKGHQFFQLLGLQIALNLVPTMNERRNSSRSLGIVAGGAKFKVGAGIEFFVPRKFLETTIFESLILEFVTRLRERRRKPGPHG